MMFLLFALLQAANAHAGSVLDWIRSYDLNDYALGVAFGVSQNPYTGASNSHYAYPYLTSFRHPAFTDDWLLIRGGDLGVRYVTESDWEFGLIGRLHTGGLGDSDLVGLDDRGWAVEAGPLLGWRGRWLQAQSRTYWPVPGRHPGSTSELELSLPVEFSRGHFVPSVTLSYMSSSYNRYYYGVTDSETAPGRPAYDPGDAINYTLGFTLGYELTSNWLLRTTIGLEHLDTSISRSPIVDKERLWSASVGLAYNADVFQPREFTAEDRPDTVRIRAGAFLSKLSSDIRRDAADGTRGNNADFEELLGSSGREAVLQAEVIFRLGYYHRLKIGYFEVDRELQAVLQQDLAFGDDVFLAGTEVRSQIDTRRMGLLYGYSLMRDAQKELGVQGGLMFTSVDLALVADATGQAEDAGIDAPLPTIGLFGSVSLGEHMELGLDVGIFALDFDRYSGYSGHASMTLERRIRESFALGIGYEYYVSRIESPEEDLRGLMRARNAGPRAYLSWTF
jgi:outer membrane protein